MRKSQRFLMSMRASICAFAVLFGHTGLVDAQIATANAVPFTSATSNTETSIKIPIGTFLPLYSTSENPTTFHIEDETYISKLTLPKDSTFGGQKYDTPGYKGWTFPTAKAEIIVLIGNNSTQTSKIVKIWAWENPGVGKKPALTGSILVELLPPSGQPTPGPVPPGPNPPNPGPKPAPIDDSILKYQGKLNLLVLEQTEDAVQMRGQLFQSKELRETLTKFLISRPRIIDIEAKTAKGVFPTDLQAYKDIYNKLSNPKLPYYFLVAEDGTIVKQGNVPLDSIASVLALFK